MMAEPLRELMSVFVKPSSSCLLCKYELGHNAGIAKRKVAYGQLKQQMALLSAGPEPLSGQVYLTLKGKLPFQVCASWPKHG